MCVNGDSDMICVPQQYSSNYIPSCTCLDYLQPKIWLEYIFYLIRKAGYSKYSNIRKKMDFASNYVAELTEKNESHATLLSCCLVVTTDIL